jgi:hypothetical protein
MIIEWSLIVYFIQGDKPVTILQNCRFIGFKHKDINIADIEK